ncbi:hypothetical protein RJ639_027218 [Escallonia herrerae]|uniref:Uncharacterized protein n=1 Tax=Escallonia herrerae TaxID=1293975 RepID=A0AA88X490_9ASTE|nr:hypothetical protein RJ639_027218 [Escallonia herrerae]
MQATFKGPADYFPGIRVVSVIEGEGSIKHVHAKTVKPELDQNGKQKQHPASPEDDQGNLVDSRGIEGDAQGIAPVDMDVSGEVNMEAFITSNDVMRAGGFGARDDISSFLPVASDSTDFEASLRDARDYEGPQEDVCRPGLGWTEVGK